jgi:carbamoyl-phosphate synthase large subunit
MTTRILITGAGAPGAAGIIKCLREIPDAFIVSVDTDPKAYGSLLTDAFETVPKANSFDFIPALLDFCKKHKINVVLPLVTKELESLSKAKTIFEENNIVVMVSNILPLSNANHKGNLLKTLQKNEIPHPAFSIANNFKEIEQAAYDLGYPNNPIIIKPCESNGLRGFRILNNSIDNLDLLLNHKPDNTYTTLDNLRSVIGDKKIPEYLVSEYLPGKEYTVDVLAKNGESLVIVPRLRSKMASGISTAGCIEKNTEIIEYVRKIVALFKLDFLIGIQVKQDIHGKYKIIEINPRVQGTTVACLGAGVNFPKLSVEMALGGELKIPEPKWGIRFARHWQELFFDE